MKMFLKKRVTYVKYFSFFFSQDLMNGNCCGTESKKVRVPPPTKVKNPPKAKKSSIELIEQIKAINISSTQEIIRNTWPISNKRIEHFTITNKRCQFSNEAISIKPITAGFNILIIMQDEFVCFQ